MEPHDRDTSDEETAQLEALDDVIFPAIAGNQAALEASPHMWQVAVAKLGKEKVEDSRAEYLRYARETWNSLCRQAVEDPVRLVAVVKIMLLLLGDGS